MSHIERETPSYNQLSISACMRQATIQSCSKRATSNTFSAHHKFRNAIAVVYLQFYLAVIWWQRLLLHRYCGVYAQCTVRACSLSLCIVVSICVFLSVFVVSSARCGRWVSLIFFFVMHIFQIRIRFIFQCTWNMSCISFCAHGPHSVWQVTLLKTVCGSFYFSGFCTMTRPFQFSNVQHEAEITKLHGILRVGEFEDVHVNAQQYTRSLFNR